MTALWFPVLSRRSWELTMNSFRNLRGLLCIGLLVGLSGCPGGEARRFAVSGTVKWQGKALDQGTITFLPEDPSLGSGGGAMIQDGHYSIPAKPGLLPGRYKVALSSADPKKALDPNADPGAPGPVYKDRVQPKYNSQTTLTAEITADGKNNFDFEVQ
jgi:hypothetical protein